jgi:hypothetical protein
VGSLAGLGGWEALGGLPGGRRRKFVEGGDHRSPGVGEGPQGANHGGLNAGNFGVGGCRRLIDGSNAEIVDGDALTIGMRADLTGDTGLQLQEANQSRADSSCFAAVIAGLSLEEQPQEGRPNHRDGVDQAQILGPRARCSPRQRGRPAGPVWPPAGRAGPNGGAASGG